MMATDYYHYFGPNEGSDQWVHEMNMSEPPVLLMEIPVWGAIAHSWCAQFRLRAENAI